MNQKVLISGFAFLALSVVVNAQDELPKVPLRIVVLTESNGVNPATSHKQIERQVMQLRIDATAHSSRYRAFDAGFRTNFIEFERSLR